MVLDEEKKKKLWKAAKWAFWVYFLVIWFQKYSELDKKNDRIKAVYHPEPVHVEEKPVFYHGNEKVQRINEFLGPPGPGISERRIFLLEKYKTPPMVHPERYIYTAYDHDGYLWGLNWDTVKWERLK